MSVKQTKVDFAYGIGDNLIQLAPRPIVAQRAPGTNDFAQIGTTWIDKSADAVYVLASITANSANWTTSPASGVGTFTAVTVNPGDVDVTAGDVNIAAGDLNVTAGNASVTGNLTVGGTLSFTGDFDLTSAQLIDMTSTLNAAPSILLEAAGGVAEQIRLHSTLGTSVNSVELDSDAGGITLVSGLASDDAINITATAGGVDIDGVMQVNIGSSENTADSIVIRSANGGIDILAAGAAAGEDIDIIATGSSVNIQSTEADIASVRILGSNAASGFDVDFGTAGIDLATTGLFDISGAAASSVNVTGAGIDLTLESAAGRVIVNGEEAAANAVTLLSAAGGIDADAALQINVDSSQAAGDAVRIVASDAAGGIDIDSGTGGVAIDSTAAFSIDGATASNVTVTGAAQDLTVSAVGGSVNVSASEADAAAVRIVASDAAGGIDVDAGTAGIAVDTTGAFSIDGAAASNVTVTGAFDLTLSSAGGSVVIDGSEAVADAIQLTASNAAGGLAIASNGLVSMVAATDTQASPTSTSTVNARVISVTFTGFTTAAGASQSFTINSTAILATSAVFVTITNLDASTNAAEMGIDGVTQAAGSVVVNTTNNGAGALGAGDNVLVNVWVLS